MTLERAKLLFTEGWDAKYLKDNPYKGKERDVFSDGQAASYAYLAKDVNHEFLLWRQYHGFPLSNRENTERNKSLIPKEFWDMMESQAWDRGHSAGQEEVDAILSNLVSDFIGASSQYAQRTGKTLA
jgi:hypothetical protein